MPTRTVTERVRPPAVAGAFYPDDPSVLRGAVDALLDRAAVRPLGHVRAVIAPHAGYRYSGPVAASVYRVLQSQRDRFRRILLIGPAHRVAFSGLATASAPAFRTPLGDTPVDRSAVDRLEQRRDTHPHDAAHAPEHALETHLPFIARAFGPGIGPSIVPLLFCDTDRCAVVDAYEALLDEQTLLLVSSDLSHFLDYDAATRTDRETADAVERLEPHRLTPHHACGHTAVQALLTVAADRGWTAHTLDLHNSGDTAGPRDRVVGYGAFAFTD